MAMAARFPVAPVPGGERLYTGTVSGLRSWGDPGRRLLKAEPVLKHKRQRPASVGRGPDFRGDPGRGAARDQERWEGDQCVARGGGQSRQPS